MCVDNLSKNCLNVFDHFVKLALKGLKSYRSRSFFTMKNYLQSDESTRGLTLIQVDFLGVRFEVFGGGLLCLKLPPVQNQLELCQKLEIWYVSTHTHVVLENLPFSTTTASVLLMSVFFPKASYFWAKIVPLRKAILCDARCTRISQFCFQFCQRKGYY